MTPKAKRKREKDRAESNSRVLEAARGTAMQEPRLLRQQWHDGVLVHRIARDRRSFNVNSGGRNNWVTRSVWTTLCGYVIAVDITRFMTTGRAPNCVRCMVGVDSPHVGRDWKSILEGVVNDA